MSKVSRPYVLWACAVLLGGAAGLNLRRIYSSSDHNKYKSLVSQGFETEGDAKTVVKLLDQTRIDVISSSDIKVLEKYSASSQMPGSMVVGVLRSVGNNDVARQVAPFANRIWKKDPNRQIVAELPNVWKERGIDLKSTGLEIPVQSIAK